MEPNDFEQIVSAHYECLYRFAFSLTHSEADARDLTQQVFYIWATKGEQLRERCKAKAWLFTTLHRAFLQSCRMRQCHPHCGLDEIRELPILTPEPVDTDDYAPVLRALGQIEDIYRAVVALYYLNECSYAEIAEILHVPLGTVKSRLARGLAQIRQILRSETAAERW